MLKHSPLSIAVSLIAPCLLVACGSDGNVDGASSVQPSSADRVTALAVHSDSSLSPVILNVSGGAHPGSVVSVQGENFGAAPVVFLNSAPDRPLEVVNRTNAGWLAVQLPSDALPGMQLSVRNGSLVSAPVKLDAAIPFHLDALQLVPGGAVRVFGRNLLQTDYTPRVLINGAVAALDLTRSDEHQLVATVPASLAASRAATITVDNGNGSGAATLDRTITVLRVDGTDPFALGVSWAAAFAPLMRQVVDAGADARLPTRARCDGTQDDSGAIQSAIELAASLGGGVVQLPVGSCRLADWLQLRSRVVLQGAGKAQTVLSYATNYPLYGVQLDLSGVRNLTLRNAGTSVEGPMVKDSTRFVMQNVAIQLGTSRQMYLSGNRQMVIQGSDFAQSGSVGQQGPYTLGSTAGLVFERNTTRWVGGAPTFEGVHDSVIRDNRFSRDATDQNQAGSVHSMTLDFAYRVAVIGNTFDVIGGPVTNTARNDGETMLTEGGSSARTENLGNVASATATTMSDPTNTLAVDPFGTGSIPENYGVAIVAGKGAGQTRRVTSYRAPTLTVDQAWSVVPDTTSRYSTFVWGLEKSLIKNNVLSQNPRGIWLYGTSVREVDIVGNVITEGGGIYLRSTQDLAAKRFTVIYNVEVARNRIVNTGGQWMSYINAVFVNIDARPFGIATLGIDIRDNDITANSPNVTSSFEEYAHQEGFANMMRIETLVAIESPADPRLLGTLLTGNSCTHCDVAVRVGTGAAGTTVIGTRLIDSGTLLTDTATTWAPDLSTYTYVRW